MERETDDGGLTAVRSARCTYCMHGVTCVAGGDRNPGTTVVRQHSQFGGNLSEVTLSIMQQSP